MNNAKGGFYHQMAPWGFYSQSSLLEVKHSKIQEYNKVYRPVNPIRTDEGHIVHPPSRIWV